MQWIFLALVAVGMTFAQSSSQAHTTSHAFQPDAATSYFDKVCVPKDDNGKPRQDTPCYAYGQSQLQCLTKYNQTQGSQYGVNETDFTPTEQQSCLCANNYFQGLMGCLDCAKAHGVPGIFFPDVAPTVISSFSASYCAASNTATVGIAQAIVSALPSYPASNTLASTINDPLSGSTAVSLYFTTATTASNNAATTTAMSGSVSATVAGSATTSTSGSATASASGSVTRASGAAATAAGVEKLAVGGVIGLAAIMVAL